MKKYLFGLLAITMAVGFSAFTTKNSAKKSFDSIDYFYVPGTSNQRLQPGHTSSNESDAKEYTITSGKFTDVDNWRTQSVSFTSTSDMSKYIGKITFNEEATADNGSDGQLTLQEALNAVFAKYEEPVAPNPDFMPATVTVDGSAVVTIIAKTAVN
jgi:uncharacterized protein YxeA